jgi:hypothetical protein
MLSCIWTTRCHLQFMKQRVVKLGGPVCDEQPETTMTLLAVHMTLRAHISKLL